MSVTICIMSSLPVCLTDVIRTLTVVRTLKVKLNKHGYLNEIANE